MDLQPSAHSESVIPYPHVTHETILFHTFEAVHVFHLEYEVFSYSHVWHSIKKIDKIWLLILKQKLSLLWHIIKSLVSPKGWLLSLSK